jgi:hypothetical protein
VKIPRIQLRATAIALATGLMLASTASAQVSTAAVSGQVAAGDKVTVRGIDNGVTREAQVKDDGRYQLRRLPVGTYDVTVHHADGSPDTTTRVMLRIGITTRIQ